MKTRVRILIVFIIIFFVTACSKDQTPKDKSTKNKKEIDSSAYPNSSLNNFDIESSAPKKTELPKDLVEISGITVAPDGRVFAQQDEKGIIFEIDLNTGDIKKKFSLGSPAIKGDFEDIVYAVNKFYMLQSNGDIYEFEEGEDGQAVQYKIHSTGLNVSNDTEGLAYDPETNSLLIACKGESGIAGEKDKAVYSFSLETMKLNPEPRFKLLRSELKGFDPSGIQRNARTGTFYLISSTGEEIIELSKDGKLIGRKKLSSSVHTQPEGIALTPDNEMLVSNEGKNGNGYIISYPSKK